MTSERVVTSAPPLLLIHGVGLDHHLWDPMRSHLSAPRRVIAYDTIGHGAGPHPPGPYRLADYSTQAAKVITDDAGAGPVDVVGFSMGALIAQHLALQNPELVRRLVLLATVHDRSPAERRAVVARVAEVRSGGYPASVDGALDRWFAPTFRANQPEVVAAVRRRMEANDVAAYADAYEVFATGDAELVDEVGAIAAPVLVVAGGDDPRSTPAMARALAAAIPRGRVLVLDGLRHCLMLEAPEAVARMIEAFLDEPVPGSSR